jgi:4-carboxymuconolactone decarboxylase
MSRLPLITREDVPEELKYVWDRTADGGMPPNIFRLMGNNPELLRSYLRLGNGLWAHCGLDLPTRELVILRTAIHAKNEYEWHQHVRIGRQAGLEDSKITALHDWRSSDLFSATERAILGYVDALAVSNHPAQEIHDALEGAVGKAAVVGVNLLTGFYKMTAGFLEGMEVETEEPFVGWRLEG